jgi:mRNA interferase MazF
MCQLQPDRTRVSEAGSSCASDALNLSRIATVVCVPLTSNLRWASAPGNVGSTLDRDLLANRVGKLARAKLELILAGIDVILGR